MVEVLSPAGDKESFYRAIESGADAIYMGAPKFNARIRASNFTLDDMREVVKYAHLKGVKIYITLNTLVSTAEMKEVILVVGEMLNMGVDAFIVQDLGIVGTLKAVYPEIVLHGSTQMGVHNVRGARVAKKLGLSRIVLSREVSLDDIREIRENVDIELEVFVQGALCVCFSGNCYLSSVKCSASGNRGECKQLCRLRYSASTSTLSKEGYLLSPKDICNAKYISDLITMGVVSFKIEGRLRRSGYVAKATSVYRQIVDDYFNAKEIDYVSYENTLKNVFARGEYTRGYFEDNDIIETSINNHIGSTIGRVKSSQKFKNIYKITIQLYDNNTINSGDGIKFKLEDDYISMGVGNVEYNGNYAIVYGKNYIPNDSIVYKSVDINFENEIVDKSKYRDIHLKVSAFVGNRFEVFASTSGYEKTFYSDILQSAKTRAITEENIRTQLGKVDERIWRVHFDSIDLDEVFLPLSKLNEVRREIISYFEDRIHSLENYSAKPLLKIEKVSARGDMAIVSEKVDIKSLVDKYERLILAPTVYSVGVVRRFVDEYTKYFASTPILKLPIIAMAVDLEVIDKILKELPNIALMAENIYGLDYIDDGFEVLAGSNVNITNDYTVTVLKSLGVQEMVGSIEKWCTMPQGLYKITTGNLVLMTFAHCPYKTISKSTCEACRYAGDIKLNGGGNNFTIRRYRVGKCYYELVDGVKINLNGTNEVRDLRDGTKPCKL